MTPSGLPRGKEACLEGDGLKEACREEACFEEDGVRDACLEKNCLNEACLEKASSRGRVGGGGRGRNEYSISSCTV
jgi:hypothetical protein